LEIFLCHHADCLSFLAFCFSRLISLSSIGWSKEIDEPPFLWLLATGLKTYAHRFFYTISLFFPLSNLDGRAKSLKISLSMGEGWGEGVVIRGSAQGKVR